MDKDQENNFFQRNALLLGKKTASVISFLDWIKQGKTATYVHPDFVAIDWKTYNKLTNNKRKPEIILDELAVIEDEFATLGEKEALQRQLDRIKGKFKL